MASKSKIMVILATIAVFGAILAPSAFAQSNPFMKAWLHQPGLNGGVSESKASSSVTVLADAMYKAGTEINSPKCHWVEEGWNSGESANGELWWFKDHHMKVCPNKKSPTGWVKVEGGMTGRRCYNPVKVGEEPEKVITGKVILVKTFGKFKAKATAKAQEEVTGTCGKAKAIAFAQGFAFGLTKVQAQGNAKLVANAKAKAAAYAKALALLVCVPPETPKAPEPPKETPKPVAPTVEIETINDFETGEQAVICARVLAPTGDGLTVTFFAKNGGNFAFGGEGIPNPEVPNEWCGFYEAPGEVPASGYDSIKVVVTDNTTHLTAEDEEQAKIKSQTSF